MIMMSLALNWLHYWPYTYNVNLQIHFQTSYANFQGTIKIPVYTKVGFSIEQIISETEFHKLFMKPKSWTVSV